MDATRFVVIHGRSGSSKTAKEYVEHIVYGTPKVLAVEVGDRFVAIASYENETNAEYTNARMGSFPHGSAIFDEEQDALNEFADWITYYASTEKRSVA